jgi:hypothetical protein
MKVFITRANTHIAELARNEINSPSDLPSVNGDDFCKLQNFAAIGA